MNRHLLRALLALYPRAFRDRYGTEVARLTDELISAGEITPLLAVLNLAGGAALEWGRVLTGSRRAAFAVSAAAVVAAAGSFVFAVAGIFYVAGHARPPSRVATARSVSAPAAIALPAAGCAVNVNSTVPGTVQITVGTNSAAQSAQAIEAPGPVVIVLPGTPSAGPERVQISSADPCAIKLPPPPWPPIVKG